MIHLNQVGYNSKLPKKAVITGEGRHCFILSSDGENTIQPTISPKLYDIASGDYVRLVDFSSITDTGEYFLFSDGLKKTFYIYKQPYNDLLGALIKSFYYLRCGCELNATHAGVYKHLECHTSAAKMIDNDNTRLDVTGGWHDAGDYGRYVAPAAVTLAHLMYSYELFPEAFTDSLNIPESGNGLPDLLNECRYELEWMLKMQNEEGGAYHKVATRYFSDFIMPEDDKDELLLFRVSHTATAGFAAALAQAYRVFKPFDSFFADKLLAAALRAWDWLDSNPDFVPFENPPDVRSGPYGDNDCEDEIFWAAAELWAAMLHSGRQEEALKFKAIVTKMADDIDISKLGWRDTGGFGALCCLFSINKLDTSNSTEATKPDNNFVEKLRSRFLSAADSFLEISKKSGYKTALAEDEYVWGSILPIMNRAIIMICAKLLTGNQSYQDAAQSQLDYLLGMNATGYSFVTGYGENSFRYPHHRASYADGVADPVPGLVSGGPNNRFPDAVCKKLIPHETPPAKFYIDDTWTASANENAIYWNSCSVFVTAYFHSL